MVKPDPLRAVRVPLDRFLPEPVLLGCTKSAPDLLRQLN
jgi:hypothetical protein